MKSILIHMSDGVLEALESELAAKACTGNLVTVSDAFIRKLLKAIQEEVPALKVGK